jgi:hypothetical protein
MTLLPSFDHTWSSFTQDVVLEITPLFSLGLYRFHTQNLDVDETSCTPRVRCVQYVHCTVANICTV